MALTTITIDAPGSAMPGSEVQASLVVKNTTDGHVHVYALGAVDGIKFVDWPEYWIPAGETHAFPGFFTMPAKDSTILASTLYEAVDGELYEDAEAQKAIKVGAEAEEAVFGNLVVSYGRA